LARIQH
jgi:hypothetical protein